MARKKSKVLGLTSAQRPPRPSLRMTGSGDISAVAGSSALMDMNTSNVASWVGAVDPTALPVITHVARNFETYKVNRHALHYTPAVGTTTPGKVWVGYTDNPEIIYKAVTGDYSQGDLLSIVKTLRHSNVFPVWQSWTMNLPSIAARRKMYSVDLTAASSAEVVDRTTHGAFLVCLEGTPSATNVGVVTASYEYALRGLQSYQATGI